MSPVANHILFLSIPGSIHDEKWIAPIAAQSNCKCYFIGVDHKRPTISPRLHKWLKEHNITPIGTLAPFSIRRFLQTIKQLHWLYRLIRKNRINKIHIFFAEPHVLWALIARILPVSVSVTTRGSDVLKGLKNTFASTKVLDRIVGRLYKVAFRNVRWVAATSTLQEDGIRAINPQLPIHIIRTGVDVSLLIGRQLSVHPKSPNKSYIFCPRVMAPLYNHEFVLDSLSSLDNSILEKYTWVFIGSSGKNTDYINHINHLMSQAPADTLFLPSQSQAEMFQLYTHASAIVMTPLSDGSPVSAMEAMVYRKPLVLGPIQYDPDLFNSETVYQMSHWDTSAFKAAIEEALQHPQKSEKAYEAVLHHGDRAKEMEKFCNLLLHDN